MYHLVEHHYSEFLEHLSHQEMLQPKHLKNEFEKFLKCSRIEHGRECEFTG